MEQQKSKFSLFWFMGDILVNFYDKNGLEHKCGNETLCELMSLNDRDAKTEKQIKWLKRWNRIDEEVDYREEERGNPSWAK